MQLEWMGDKRLFVEKFIRLFNTYAQHYAEVHHLEGTSVETSAAQIQTLEYIIEANGTQKMTEIAARMGITRGAFSNNVQKLIKRGYLIKKQDPSNKKEIFVTATAKGLKAYREYSNFIYEECFKDIFELADAIPHQHQETLFKILDVFTEAFSGRGERKRNGK